MALLPSSVQPELPLPPLELPALDGVFAPLAGLLDAAVALLLAGGALTLAVALLRAWWSAGPACAPATTEIPPASDPDSPPPLPLLSKKHA